MTLEPAVASSRIFLSYAGGDRDRAAEIARRLTDSGVAVWIEHDDIAGATSWSAETVQAIRSCSAFALLCSRASMASTNVQRELQLALESHRPVLPLVLEPADIPNAIAHGLAGLQRVNIGQRPERDWLPEVLRGLAAFGAAAAAPAKTVVSPPASERRDIRPAKPSNRVGGERQPTAARAVAGTAKRSLFAELKRRHVFAVGTVYFVAVWGLLQVAGLVLPAFDAPAWVLQALIVAGVAGFPLALALSYVFDLTPAGVVRTDEVDVGPSEVADDIDSSGSNELRLDERRHITVMYSEYSFAAGDGEDLDPEVIRASQSALTEVVQSVVSRFPGYVQRLDGDGLVLYFGYPEAREEDARRAVRCGLAIAEGLRRAAERIAGLSGAMLTISTGIDSGVAVVESQRDQRPTQVLERITRRAQRIVTASEPGQLVISASTQRLVRGYFEVQERGSVTLPGSSQPTGLLAVIHESGARNRVEARESLIRLTGRAHELDLLKARWDQTLQGDGQFVLLSGEAGMGKSRLLHELKQYVATNPGAWINECFCSPDTTNRPLHPVIDTFQRDTVGELPDNASRLGALQGLFAQFGFDLTTAVPLFAELLGIDVGDQYEPLQMAPKRKKELITRFVIELVLARSQTQPVLLVVEDLHWSDPSFADLIRQLVDYGPTKNLLCVCTTRPNTVPEWAKRNHITTINLSGLSNASIAELIRATPKGETLREDALQQLVGYAQGNPLYAEELTLGLSGGPSGSDPEGHIPATLQESLMSRLDMLRGEVKTVAKLAATLGAKFDHDLLAAFANRLNVRELDTELRALVDADILYQRGKPPAAQYAFKHVLLQEAAYQTILKRERETYHAQIAEILQAQFSGFAGSHPEILAHHLSCAKQNAAAVPCWYSAGRKAAQQSAPVEARNYLRRALDEMLQMPVSDERNVLELDIQIALGAVLMATNGYTSPDVRGAYERAIELCEASTPSARLAPAIFGLWTHRVVAGDLTGAVELGNRLLRIAEDAHSEDLLLESHVLYGVTLSYTGPMEESLRHLEAAAAMYKIEKHGSHAYTFGQDPLMAAVSYKGLALWWLGRPDEAQQACEQAVEIARKLGHARSLAFALANAARCHLKCGDYPRCVAVADEAAQLSARLGFPDFKAMAEFHLRAATYQLAPTTAALAAMTAALAELRAVGNSVSTPYYYSVVALACAEQREFRQAYSALASGHQALSRHGRECDEAEVYRVTGCVNWRARQAGDAQAEDHAPWLRRALAVATEQGAVSWRLLAAITRTEELGDGNEAGQTLAQLADARAAMSGGGHLPALKRADALLRQQT